MDEDFDFYLYCDNEYVEDDAMEDVVSDWKGMGQEQQNDTLSCIDNLACGDYTYVADHHVKCTSSYITGSPATLAVTVH